MDQPQIVPHHPSERGDELDLIGLWKVLVEYKLLIIVFTTLTTLGATYYASTLPTIYKAEVLMISSKSINGDRITSGKLGGLASMAGISINSSSNIKVEQALARLKTYSFLVDFIKEKNLKPILFPNKWIEKTKKWVDEEPSDIESYKLFSGMVSGYIDPNDPALITHLLISAKNPSISLLDSISKLANGLVEKMNSDAKKELISESRKSVIFLKEEIEQTGIINFKTMLYGLIEQHMRQITVANVKNEFIFKIIDPAITPIKPEAKKTLSIIFIGMFLGVFIGAFFAVNINNFRKNQK
jgi:LPS O-antigen subunit length determinant protein (WzzB/FepE family)